MSIIFQLILITVNALFSCAEIAVITTNDNKLEKMAADGDKRAIRLVTLTSRPSSFLATIQVGITLAGFLGSAFAAESFTGGLTDRVAPYLPYIPVDTIRLVSLVVITIVLSYVTLVLGELVPKRIAMQNAEKIALAMSAFIYGVSRFFAPVVWLLTKSTNGILRLCGIDPNAEPEEATEEEIRMMVDVGTEKGTIEENEKEIIHNVFEFDNKTADDVMTHRVDAELLWLEEDDETWAKVIRSGTHSHYPICGDTPDDIRGVLNVKSYYRLMLSERDDIMAKAVENAWFIPESVKAGVLFRNMKNKKNHFAIVLDDRGGMSGIVTINDLIEELVGDFDDDAESEPEQPPVIKIADGDRFECVWRISGAAGLSEVEDELNIELPANEYDTFASLVLGVLGTIPGDGETPTADAFGMHIEVTLIRDHRLDSAEVRLIKNDDDNKSDNKTGDKGGKNGNDTDKSGGDGDKADKVAKSENIRENNGGDVGEISGGDNAEPPGNQENN